MEINTNSDLIKALKTIQTPENEVVINNAINHLRKDFFELVELLNSKEWPEAVESFLICEDNENDKNDRAEGIIDFINEEFENKKFLDFGCGEGHVVNKIENYSASIGYDVVKSGIFNWEEETSNKLLTTNFDKILKFSPYDIILLYDVLDHINNPEDVLEKIKTLCHKNTKIHVRCHPWTSRHAIHQYKNVNKAFVNLIFTTEELKEMNIEIDKNQQKTFFPILENKKWFNNTKFKIIEHETKTTIVEDFFKKTKIINDVLTIDKYKNEFPEWQMSQDFNDYVLMLEE